MNAPGTAVFAVPGALDCRQTRIPKENGKEDSSEETQEGCLSSSIIKFFEPFHTFSLFEKLASACRQGFVDTLKHRGLQFLQSPVRCFLCLHYSMSSQPIAGSRCRVTQISRSLSSSGVMRSGSTRSKRGDTLMIRQSPRLVSGDIFGI